MRKERYVIDRQQLTDFERTVQDNCFNKRLSQEQRIKCHRQLSWLLRSRLQRDYDNISFWIYRTEVAVFIRIR